VIKKSILKEQRKFKVRMLQNKKRTIERCSVNINFYIRAEILSYIFLIMFLIVFWKSVLFLQLGTSHILAGTH